MYLKKKKIDLETINKIINYKEYFYKLKKNTIKLNSKIFKKPWGFEYCLKSRKEIAIWILYLKRKQQTSLHAHVYKKTFLIPANKLLFNGLNKKKLINPFSIVKIDNKTFHQSSNNTKKDFVLFEIEKPNNKFDIVRYKDKYKRDSFSYDIKTLNSLKIKKLVKKINQKYIYEILGKKTLKYIKLKKGFIVILLQGNLKINGKKIKNYYPHKIRENCTIIKGNDFFNNLAAVVIKNNYDF